MREDPGPIRRGSLRRPGSVAALALIACLAAAAPPQPRCLSDALEHWFCASDPRGVAVLDNTGEVVCAAGRCVEVEDEWQCSDVSGGDAALTPDGAVCTGSCRSPRAAACERM